ncbi:MAG: hypothetical protein LUD81_06860 [Clostridiales bacterium]|nr:hypothetical protein [Clostridiales bacterium]
MISVVFAENLIFKGLDDGEEVVEMIKGGADVFNVFLLCKAQNQNLFELLEVSEIFKDYYAKKNFKVLGLAGGKKNGMLLVKEIIASYYNKHGNLEGLKKSL